MKNKAFGGLLKEIRKFGEFNVGGCFNCGSCTLSCDLSKNSASFPRRLMQYSIMGLKDRLHSSLEPWLCYYCGDCSTACPQKAEPGESMMTLRRYLTAQYDWTRIASWLYRSAVWEIGALLLVAAFVLFLAVRFHGPIVTDRVELETFAPVELVHRFDLILLVTLSAFLLSNAFRMYWLTIVRSGVKIPLGNYLSEIKTLLVHFVTQKRFLDCGQKTGRWLKHWLLVTGYVLMFFLVICFLGSLYTNNPFHSLIGFYATGVLIYATVEILIARMKKQGEALHRYSELSDMIFPVLLLLTALTGILTHVFRTVGLPLPTYSMYVIHLMIAVPMLVIEVPFGKWAHLAYRPLAIYFQAIKEKTLSQEIRRGKAAA